MIESWAKGNIPRRWSPRIHANCSFTKNIKLIKYTFGRSFGDDFNPPPLYPDVDPTEEALISLDFYRPTRVSVAYSSSEAPGPQCTHLPIP